jgi:hypothetical protein
MIPQNVCQCLCLITIPPRSFHRTCGGSQKYRYPCAHIYSGIWLFWPPWGSEGGENIGKSSYLNLPDIGFTLFTPINMVGYVKIARCTTIMAQFSSTSGLQDSLTYMYYTSKYLYMSLFSYFSGKRRAPEIKTRHIY